MNRGLYNGIKTIVVDFSATNNNITEKDIPLTGVKNSFLIGASIAIKSPETSPKLPARLMIADKPSGESATRLASELIQGYISRATEPSGYAAEYSEPLTFTGKRALSMPACFLRAIVLNESGSAKSIIVSAEIDEGVY